jgi:hypothetical protein
MLGLGLPYVLSNTATSFPINRELLKERLSRTIGWLRLPSLSSVVQILWQGLREVWRSALLSPLTWG